MCSCVWPCPFLLSAIPHEGISLVFAGSCCNKLSDARNIWAEIGKDRCKQNGCNADVCLSGVIPIMLVAVAAVLVARH